MTATTRTPPDYGTQQAILLEVGHRHPGTQGIIRFFAWAHLPEHLQKVSQPFYLLALTLLDLLEDGPELTVGLRKLLEAKDCCVRQATLQKGSDT